MNKKWIYPLGALIIGFIAFFFYNRYNLPPTIAFDKLSLTDVKGNPVKFDAYNGKKKFVCFSASWCPNCLEELRDLNKIKDTELSDIEIIVISDEPLEKINSFIEKKSYTFTFLKLEQGFGQIGIYSIPTSYLVNDREEIKKETVGYIDWTDPSTCQHMKKLLE